MYNVLDFPGPLVGLSFTNITEGRSKKRLECVYTIDNIIYIYGLPLMYERNNCINRITMCIDKLLANKDFLANSRQRKRGQKIRNEREKALPPQS